MCCLPVDNDWAQAQNSEWHLRHALGFCQRIEAFQKSNSKVTLRLKE